MLNLQGNNYPGGLQNLGNTCYANAVIQVLCYTPGLYEHLKKVVIFIHRVDRVRSILKELVPLSAQEKLALPQSCAFADSLFRVFRIIRLERRTCRPMPLLRILRAAHCAFTPGEEHDAQELLLCALDAVQSALRDLHTFRASLVELARGLAADAPGRFAASSVASNVSGCSRMLPLPQRFAGAGSLDDALAVPEIRDDAMSETTAATADKNVPLLHLDDFADDDEAQDNACSVSNFDAGVNNIFEDEDLLFLSTNAPPVSTSAASAAAGSGADRAASTPSPPSPRSPCAAEEEEPDGAIDLLPGLSKLPDSEPPQQQPLLNLQVPKKSFSRNRDRSVDGFDRAFSADAFKLRGGARTNARLVNAESPRRPLGQQNLVQQVASPFSASAAAAAAATSAAVAAASAAITAKRPLGDALPALLLPATLQTSPASAQLPMLSAAVAAISAAGDTNDENLGASPLKRPRRRLSSSGACLNVAASSSAAESAESASGAGPKFSLAELLARIEALDIGDTRMHDFVASRMTGQQQYTTRCLECEAETVKCQPFNIISCPVKRQRHSSASAAGANASAGNFEPQVCGDVRIRTVVAEPDGQLNMSTDSDSGAELPFPHCALQEEERLTGEDKFLCERCNELQEASLRLTYGCLPAVVCLHLKRFSLDSRGCVTKINDPVQIPCHFQHREPEGRERRYQLFGVIIHDGLTISSGHYTSLVRINADSGEGDGSGCWFSFDDDFVRPVSAIQLAAVLSPSETASKTPYVVMYSAEPDRG